MIRHALAATTFLIGSALPSIVRGHFFWAETDEAADHVTVTFSEDAGVPDKVIAMMESRVKTMAYTAGSEAEVNIAVNLNSDKTFLEGDLPQSLLRSDGHNDPALVSGYLDFGPFMKFEDLQYTFGAQVYSSEADYDAFFRPLLLKGDKPTIVMRNCGGNKGTSYQIDVGGFPSGGPLGVCIYRKGGLKMGCGEWESDEHALAGTSVGRSLRFGENLLSNADLSINFSHTAFEQKQEDAPYLLYAMANKTITDKESGDIRIVFASTSVYFEGPCKE
mmetsp:Transcript_9487/g.23283  ORF Transcript_9487/g.23283 Transcript_9487/m.23283 type:complete len:276 (+) Transcript_9487:211-1038(+)|eukprot:CAMPEP_0197193088 /NCGR_PEP_ID=MMETSP1423-20130617/26398_1 /TAXON_ID=476441 /ORGANISM="Pseudo-nitzschia heimii, Strain UNC1101" /LENGTH=275 /DNA_ID=CAMNT_0042646155 /DNA_START=148 /DNA_END=975 /DNA_ORIENTATION=-